MKATRFTTAIRLLRSSSVLAAAIISHGSSAFAADYTWNSDLGGAYNGAWTDISPDGWNGGPPVGGDTALIDNGTVTATTHNQQQGVLLTIGYAGVLNDGGNYLYFSGGSLTLNSGTINVSFGGEPFFRSGGLGSAVTANSGTSFINNTGTAGYGLALESGGTTFTGAGNLVLGLGLFDLLNVAAGVTKSGAGTLTMSTAAASGYTGATTVNDGTLALTATDFEFTYSRLDLSLADTTQTFEYGSDLSGWNPVLIPAGPGVSTVGAATVTIIHTGTTDSVKISIPKSVSPGGKLFGRLKVVK